MSARLVMALCLAVSGAFAQEANSGLDLNMTLTGQAIYDHSLSTGERDGTPVDAAFRGVIYPEWKISPAWSFSAAIQVNSAPFFPGEFDDPGHGISVRVLQANLAYSHATQNGSIVVRAGEMLSAFGSFLLRYDDAVNPMTNAPMQYGYYYSAVTTGGLAGAQVDVTYKKLDARAQFTNSSPANPRTIFDKDQYGNWAGGAGYTIRQGLRIGASAYRGPYLDRQYAYYFRGEAPPHELPATGLGVDGKWGFGHWDVNGEWQKFVMDYRAIPVFREDAGYVEAKRVLSPHWYVAGRAGYLHSRVNSGGETYEVAVGYRPGVHELIKAGYAVERVTRTGDLAPVVLVQFVGTLHPFSAAWK
jgi:hypothetical protein